MRRRIVSTIAAGAAAVLMLSGFDSAMTIQELQEKSKSAIAEVTSLSMMMNGRAAADLKMTQNAQDGASMNVPITGMLDISCQLNLEPLQLAFSFVYNAEAVGQGTEGSMEMYVLENEDGTGIGYMGVTSNGETDWQVDKAEVEDVSKMKEMVQAALKGDTSAMSSAAPSGNVDPAAMEAFVQKYQDMFASLAQISPTSVSAGGKECYEITADMTGDTFFEVMKDVMSATGQPIDDASLQMIQPVMGGIHLKSNSRIDVETYLPVDAELDLGDSDFSAFGDMIASSMGAGTDMSAQVDVHALSMKAMFDFNNPVDIVVPEAALAAASGADTTGGDDSLGGLLTGGDDSLGGLLTGGDDTTGTDTSESGAIQNPDGSYHLEYENYDGRVKKADVAAPEGLHLSYGTEDYISFSNDDYTYGVTYSFGYKDTTLEMIQHMLDTSFYDSNSDYSDVVRTDIKQTTLPDGTDVYYGTVLYTYSGYRFGGTKCVLQAGDWIVCVEIEKEDEQRRAIEASEEEVQTYTALVRPAA